MGLFRIDVIASSKQKITHLEIHFGSVYRNYIHTKYTTFSAKYPPLSPPKITCQILLSNPGKRTFKNYFIIIYAREECDMSSCWSLVLPWFWQVLNFVLVSLDRISMTRWQQSGALQDSWTLVQPLIPGSYIQRLHRDDGQTVCLLYNTRQWALSTSICQLFYSSLIEPPSIINQASV